MDGNLNEHPENEQSEASPSTAFETSVVLNDEGLTEHRLGSISSISRWSEMREGLRKIVTENCKCSNVDKPTVYFVTRRRPV